MKKICAILVSVLLTTSVGAQSSEKMSYQAVIRNTSDALVSSTQVGMQISILQGSASGTAVYVETQSPTTNANGLVSIEIGDGAVVTGDIASIDWANGPYFIKIETDPSGGTSYTITGTSQLLSVPYALHAKTAKTITGTITETDPNVPVGTQTGQMQYWNGTAWVTVAAGNDGQVLTFRNGEPVWSSIVKAFLLDTIDVYNPTTGKIWMDRNLGASRVAISSTDAAAYGDLYQWGRAADGHESRTSGTTSVPDSSDTPEHDNFITTESSPFDWRDPQNDKLWQGVSGINNPCPNGYRLPTAAEWEAERQSWSSNNAAGAFASPLKLPVAGYRNGFDGSLDVDGYGIYWSSTVDGTYSRNIYIYSGSSSVLSDGRAFGYSVRCIKDLTY